jgi:hypothetical protein
MRHREADGVPSNDLGRHGSTARPPFLAVELPWSADSVPNSSTGLPPPGRILGSSKTYPLSRCPCLAFRPRSSQTWLDKSDDKTRKAPVGWPPGMKSYTWESSTRPDQVSFQPVNEESCQQPRHEYFVLSYGSDGELLKWVGHLRGQTDRCPAHFSNFLAVSTAKCIGLTDRPGRHWIVASSFPPAVKRR